MQRSTLTFAGGRRNIATVPNALRIAGFSALLLALLAATPGRAAQPLPPPGPRERCPVCGMFVAPHPTWVAALRRADGAIEYFDGPKDLFRRMFAAPESGRRGEPFVTDYYRTEPIAARGAWFAVGGDVLGPMGRDLVPFATESEARGFLKDHGGTRVVPFTGVTPDLLRALE